MVMVVARAARAVQFLQPIDQHQTHDGRRKLSTMTRRNQNLTQRRRRGALPPPPINTLNTRYYLIPISAADATRFHCCCHPVGHDNALYKSTYLLTYLLTYLHTYLRQAECFAQQQQQLFYGPLSG